MIKLTDISSMKMLGFALLASGLLVLLLIGKRRFERRGAGGLQHFRNYWRALIVSFFERLAQKLSVAMIIVALLILLVDWYNQI